MIFNTCIFPPYMYNTSMKNLALWVSQVLQALVCEIFTAYIYPLLHIYYISIGGQLHITIGAVVVAEATQVRAPHEPPQPHILYPRTRHARHCRTPISSSSGNGCLFGHGCAHIRLPAPRIWDLPRRCRRTVRCTVWSI